MWLTQWSRRLSKWLQPRKVDDPDFGPITFRPGVLGVWDREPGLEQYYVRIFASDSGPTDFQRKLFLEFKERLVTLAKEIEKPLWQEYMSIRELALAEESSAGGDEPLPFDLDFPPIAQPEDIWIIAHLIGIEISDESHHVHLGLMYEMDWSDEHVLSVYIKNWKVLDVGKEG